MMEDEEPSPAVEERDWWCDEPERGEIERRWADLPADPDLADDLGYRMVELDVLTTGNSEPQVIFLPRDEEIIMDDMFVVVDDASLCELIDWT